MMVGGSDPPFVPADDRLFPPLAHGGLWLVLGIVAGILTVALVVWIFHRAPDPVAEGKVARVAARQRYLAEVDELHRRYLAGELDERQLHHALSSTVRRFAADHGAPGALAMTAADLGEAGYGDVAGVVAGYVPPQFMERTWSDPPRSVAAAKHLIEATGERSDPAPHNADASEPAHGRVRPSPRVVS